LIRADRLPEKGNFSLGNCDASVIPWGDKTKTGATLYIQCATTVHISSGCATLQTELHGRLILEQPVKMYFLSINQNITIA